MSDDIKKYRSIIAEGYQPTQATTSAASDASVQATAALILESMGNKKYTSDSLFETLINHLPSDQDKLNRKFAVAVLCEMQHQRKKAV